MKTSDSRERFSTRVQDYVRYRPGYPVAAIAALTGQIPHGAVVADIGAGTGIFTRLLLQAGLTVYAVEPNPNMRAAAEATLRNYPGFTSVAAAAEDTGLADRSVDLVTAAQAFHWFHNDRSAQEFRRILRPDGKLALIWNKRDQNEPFQQGYHELLGRHASEYAKVNHMKLDDEQIGRFYGGGEIRVTRMANSQRLDLAGLLGRLKSASYCPAEDSPEFRRLTRGIEALLAEHGRDGCIDFAYETRLYVGSLGA